MFIIELNKESQFEFKTMSFKHQNSEAVFSLADESDGTIRLLDIIEVLRYDSDISLLEKILQAFLMHCGSYTKEFGTDSFVYSVTKFADSTYKSALKQAEKNFQNGF